MTGLEKEIENKVLMTIIDTLCNNIIKLYKQNKQNLQ